MGCKKVDIIDIQLQQNWSYAGWSSSLIFFIGCRESQDADEQGASFHPSKETRSVFRFHETKSQIRWGDTNF